MSYQTKSNTQTADNETQLADRFGFWQKWLLVATEIYIIFGLFIVVFNSTVLFDLFNKPIYAIFFGTAVPPSVIPFQGWLYALMGSILAAWGLNMFFITNNAFKKREKWAWQALLSGLLLWYVLDSTASVYFGVLFNAALNTVFLIIGLLPLYFTRKQFV